MAREAAAWHEGYSTALHDFDIRVTSDQIPKLSRNPHGDGVDESLTEYERAEIRQALGFHFEDCPGEWDPQAEIVTIIVERILSRRPGRGA